MDIPSRKLYFLIFKTNLRVLFKATLAILQNSAEEIPRAFVVLNYSNPVHDVMQFDQHIVVSQTGVFQNEKPLIPGGIIPHIGGNQFVYVD